MFIIKNIISCNQHRPLKWPLNLSLMSTDFSPHVHSSSSNITLPNGPMCHIVIVFICISLNLQQTIDEIATWLDTRIFDKSYKGIYPIVICLWNIPRAMSLWFKEWHVSLIQGMTCLRLPISIKASRHWSKSVWLWTADIWTLIRASPVTTQSAIVTITHTNNTKISQ